MNKIFFIAFFFAVCAFNVEALRKMKFSESAHVTVEIPKPSETEGSFLEGETSSFELFNFYEYYFYCQAYELYNDYALNSGACVSTKRQYWFEKKLDAVSIANFCNLIAGQINSSYLGSYLCGYISNTASWFNTCSY